MSEAEQSNEIQQLFRRKVSRRGMLKVTGVVAAASLAGPALAACGPNTAGTSSGPVQVNLWHSIPPASATYWQQQLLAPWEKTHPQYKIVLTQLGKEDPARIRAGLAAGGAQAPAMAWIASSQTGAYVQANVLADVQSWLNSNPTIQQDIIPSLLNLSSYQGKVRSLPWMTNDCAILINTQAFQQANVPIPSQDPATTWTWDEFTSACQKLTTSTQKALLMPVGDASWDPWIFHAFITQAGGEFLSSEGKPSFASAAGIEAMTFLRQLVSKGYTAFGQLGKGSDAGPWYSGKVAMNINGPWIFPTLSTFQTFPFTVVPFPRNKRAATNLGGDQLFIFNRSASVNAGSLAYAGLMLSDDFQIKFNIQSGNLPVTTSSTKSAQYQSHLKQYPFLYGWVNQIPYGVPRIPIPQYTDVANTFAKAWDDILLNNAAVQSRLQQAASEAAAITGQ